MNFLVSTFNLIEYKYLIDHFWGLDLISEAYIQEFSKEKRVK